MPSGLHCNSTHGFLSSCVALLLHAECSLSFTKLSEFSKAKFISNWLINSDIEQTGLKSAQPVLSVDKHVWNMALTCCTQLNLIAPTPSQNGQIYK